MDHSISFAKLVKRPASISFSLMLSFRISNGVLWLRKYCNTYFFLFIASLPIFLTAIFLSQRLPDLQEWTSGMIPSLMNRQKPNTDSIQEAFGIAIENKEIDRLKRELSKYTPRGGYLVINTSENRFRLFAGGTLIREGLCSTGSYSMLSDGKEKKWYFKTPKGIFRIRDKKVNPVWKKPDWAFVEEGLPVPPANHPSRFEYGSLGDYALSLGDGYLIHGTLYQRFLGLPVTHGCIRLGDDDLKSVYTTLKIGSYVFIY